MGASFEGVPPIENSADTRIAGRDGLAIFFVHSLRSGPGNCQIPRTFRFNPLSTRQQRAITDGIDPQNMNLRILMFRSNPAPTMEVTMEVPP